MDLIVFVTIIFLVCYPGEKVMNFCEDILYEVTQRNLISIKDEVSNVKNLKMINFLVMRTQKPLKITIGTMKEMNLQFFSQTMKLIYSFGLILRIV